MACAPKGYARPALRGSRGVGLALRHSFDVVDSTQAIAAGLARDGAPDGSYVVARAQRAGRGRLDHTWSSPPGGLYLSLVVAEPARALSLAPLAFGLAVADVVAVHGVVTSLKWPNDVVVPSTGDPPSKLAGILVDRVVSPTLGHALVVGVGVNVAADPTSFSPTVRAAIMQLSELTPAPPSLAELEETLVPRLRASAEALRTRGGELTTVARCRAALYGRGRAATVDGVPVGVIDELDEDGSLWVRRRGRRENVRAGHLVVTPA